MSDFHERGANSIAAYDCAGFDERLLLREYTHRMNNELASAISAISTAAARSASTDARAAFSAVEEMLHNYAQVHHALQMPEYSLPIDAAAYVRQLCLAISRSKLEGKGIELLLVERTFRMDAERCWRLGLILSELITNSFRHAFTGDGGTIRVELFPSRWSLECHVEDDGVSELNPKSGRGFEIIDALVESLGGTIRQYFGPEGTASVLLVPRSAKREVDRGRRQQLNERFKKVSSDYER
jgi:two-component sensor histidine kinase